MCLANDTLRTDRAAVEFDQFLYQSEADAAAFVSPAAGILDAMEAVKQPGNLFCRDSYSRISHA